MRKKRTAFAVSYCKAKGIYILLCLCLLFIITSGCGSNAKAGEEATLAEASPPAVSEEEQKLICRSIENELFIQSLQAPRFYEANGLIRAGVVPHHTVGASLISGFFELASKGVDYDTVVVVAPNHDGDIADVILSLRNWEAGGEVLCDKPLTQAILDMSINNVRIAANDERVAEDHSASVMIPYIRYYFPEAKVVPVLVSRTLTLDETVCFADFLSGVIKEAGKRVLLVCSVDFSHYLTPEEAAVNGKDTVEAVMSLDYKKLHDYPNEYMDSPATMIIFLRYLSSMDIQPRILDYADASEFLGPGVPETTSYFVMLGEESEV